jgi:hypothetical protein
MKRYFLIILLGLTFAINAFAHPDSTPPGERFYKNLPEYAQLPADKKTFVDKTLHDSFEKTRAEGSMLFAKMAMLNAKLMQPTVDKKEVDTLMGEINHMHADLLQTRVDTIIKIKEATGITLPLIPPRGKMMMRHQEGHPLLENEMQ